VTSLLHSKPKTQEEYLNPLLDTEYNYHHVYRYPPKYPSFTMKKDVIAAILLAYEKRNDSMFKIMLWNSAVEAALSYSILPTRHRAMFSAWANVIHKMLPRTPPYASYEETSTQSMLRLGNIAIGAPKGLLSFPTRSSKKLKLTSPKEYRDNILNNSVDYGGLYLTDFTTMDGLTAIKQPKHLQQPDTGHIANMLAVDIGWHSWVESLVNLKDDTTRVWTDAPGGSIRYVASTGKFYWFRSTGTYWTLIPISELHPSQLVKVRALRTLPTPMDAFSVDEFKAFCRTKKYSKYGTSSLKTMVQNLLPNQLDLELLYAICQRLGMKNAFNNL